ncbi:MAG: hypothetical protein MMC23_001193 [Stictis urceolatum]|nr:hypothetical protein [Stictis urceolata]
MDGLIEIFKSVGILYIGHSILGHGWLVDKSTATLLSITCPMLSSQFEGKIFYKNRAIVGEFQKPTSKNGSTTPQIALAWVIAQGIIAIARTTQASRLEKYRSSRDVGLTKEEFRDMREFIDAAKPHGTDMLRQSKPWWDN